MTDHERKQKIACNIEAISKSDAVEYDETFDYLFSTVIMLNERVNELSADVHREAWEMASWR